MLKAIVYQRLLPMKRLKTISAFIALSLLAIGLYAPPATARYQPKKVRRYIGRTVPTATRGSCEGLQTQQSLIPLAPLSHIGQTATPTPTVTWSVPDQTTYEITFRLWQQTSPDKETIVWSKTGIQSQPGLMQLTLPAEAKLIPDTQYRWQVVLKCNPSKPSQNQAINAYITYTPTPDIQPTPSSPTEQVDRLATANLWYDALTAALPHPTLYRSLLTDLETVEANALSTEEWPSAQKQNLTKHQTSLRQLIQPSEPVPN
jgi:hypothetical protein